MTELTPDTDGVQRNTGNLPPTDPANRFVVANRTWDTTWGWKEFPTPNGSVWVFFLTIREGGMTFALPFVNQTQLEEFLGVGVREFNNRRTESGLFIPGGGGNGSR